MPTQQSKPEAQLNSPITVLNGLGPKTARSFAKLGVFVLEDLLYFFPRRYDDRSKLTPLAALMSGMSACVVAEVSCVTAKSNKIEAEIKDSTGTAGIIWFSRKPAGFLKKGMKLAVCGGVYASFHRLMFSHPEFEVLHANTKPSIIGKIFPVYPGTEGLPQKTIARFIALALSACEECVKDFMPQSILKQHGLPALHDALAQIHNPDNAKILQEARKRLAFDEFFLLQAGMRMLRKAQAACARTAIITPGKKFNAFMNALPFTLTSSQKKAVSEILADLAKPEPMNRLLHGDVGSGKTIVAAAAFLAAADSGVQSAFMAPTEVLAHQHYIKLKRFLEPLGLKVGLLTGNFKQSERKAILDDIKSGAVDIVIGTHALSSAQTDFHNLALVVIDEQHRFGVLQRGALISKGIHPHVLSMSATPIPRTLTYTVYGNLDVSELREIPPGRQKIETYAMHYTQYRKLAKKIRARINNHEQVYWVCPAIEENANSLSSVNEVYDTVRELMPEMRTGLLHGRLSVREKAEIMSSFAAGKIDILVATSIIEVGIDVPGAAMIIIEDAGQFGLAQLHQLRGRVGRGRAQSECVLLHGQGTTPEGMRRIEVMTQNNDGFAVAEMDLRQRGAGEFCGTRQHGITDFKIADLARDEDLLLMARDDAQKLLDDDPELKSAPDLKNEILHRLGDVLDLAAIQ